MSKKRKKQTDAGASIFDAITFAATPRPALGELKRDPRWDDPRCVPMQPLLNRGCALQVRVVDGGMIDTRPLYTLSSFDVATIQEWIPRFKPGDGFLGELEAILIASLNVSPGHCREMTMPQILAVLRSRPRNGPNAPEPEWDANLLADLRKAITKLGKEAKPSCLELQVSAGRQRARRHLRYLESLGEYSGFCRPVPARYRKR